MIHPHTLLLTLSHSGHDDRRSGGHHSRHGDRAGSCGVACWYHHGLLLTGWCDCGAGHQLWHSCIVMRLGEDVGNKAGACRSGNNNNLRSSKKKIITISRKKKNLRNTAVTHLISFIHCYTLMWRFTLYVVVHSLRFIQILLLWLTV